MFKSFLYFRREKFSSIKLFYYGFLSFLAKGRTNIELRDQYISRDQSINSQNSSFSRQKSPARASNPPSQSKIKVSQT